MYMDVDDPIVRIVCLVFLRSRACVCLQFGRNYNKVTSRGRGNSFKRSYIGLMAENFYKVEDFCVTLEAGGARLSNLKVED